MEGRGSDTRNKYGLRAGKLWKLPLCGSRGKLNYKGNFSTASTSLGKLSARNKSAEIFPQFPQLRRLGLIWNQKPVSQVETCCVRQPGTCLGKLSVHRHCGCLQQN